MRPADTDTEGVGLPDRRVQIENGDILTFPGNATDDQITRGIKVHQLARSIGSAPFPAFKSKAELEQGLDYLPGALSVAGGLGAGALAAGLSTTLAAPTGGAALLAAPVGIGAARVAGYYGGGAIGKFLKDAGYSALGDQPPGTTGLLGMAREGNRQALFGAGGDAATLGLNAVAHGLMSTAMASPGTALLRARNAVSQLIKDRVPVDRFPVIGTWLGLGEKGSAKAVANAAQTAAENERMMLQARVQGQGVPTVSTPIAEAQLETMPETRVNPTAVKSATPQDLFGRAQGYVRRRQVLSGGNDAAANSLADELAGLRQTYAGMKSSGGHVPVDLTRELQRIAKERAGEEAALRPPGPERAPYQSPREQAYRMLEDDTRAEVNRAMYYDPNASPRDNQISAMANLGSETPYPQMQATLAKQSQGADLVKEAEKARHLGRQAASVGLGAAAYTFGSHDPAARAKRAAEVFLISQGLADPAIASRLALTLTSPALRAGLQVVPRVMAAR